MRQRHVVLTGAAGFVGRQVARSLAVRGVAVTAVVRAGGRVPEPVEGLRVVASRDLFAESADWWAGVCDGADTVVHAAWYAEPGQYLQSPRNLHCLAGTLALADGALRAGVRRFVGIGTCLEYDLAGDGPLVVDTPLRPASPYAAAKAAAFLALAEHFRARGAEFAWCRLFYLYGEGEDARRLVPYLRARLAVGEPAELTSGTQVRDFLDVAEAGRRIAAVALGSVQGAVNICSGVPVTVRELAEGIADRYGRRELLRFGAQPDRSFGPPCVVGVPADCELLTE